MNFKDYVNAWIVEPGFIFEFINRGFGILYKVIKFQIFPRFGKWYFNQCNFL